MPDIVCLGEALIDFVALEACTDVGAAAGFIKAPGGAPANVAVGVARLGRTCAFLGKVGDDPFGRFLGRTIQEAGVDISGMVFDPVHRTGLAFVSLTDSGERDFCFFRNPSADMTYSIPEVDLGLITGCRIFHFGSITMIDRAAKAATLHAMNSARAAGNIISYDPNLRPPLWPSLKVARRVILSAMSGSDIVKVSEEELAFLFSAEAELPESRPELGDTKKHALRLLKRHPNIAILAVTRGAEGCLWWTRAGEHGALSGHKVTAVDTTGAGDGFVAGMLTALLDLAMKPLDSAALGNLPNKDLGQIFARANAVGAIATTRKGAIPALPTLAEIQYLITSN